MFSVVDGRIIDFDRLSHLFVKAVASTEIRWRETHVKNMWYYYAQSELYILRTHVDGILCYSFVKARSPQEAANKVIAGKDTNVLANAPDNNVGRKDGEE